MAAKKFSISNLIFKPAEEEAPAQQTAAPASAQSFSPAQQFSSVAGKSVIGQEDSQIKEQLLTALEQANMPGYDYWEFAKAVDAQAQFIPGEAVRFQSTFAMASSTDKKVTVDSLVASADHYMSVLKDKETEFLNALEDHSKNSVSSKEQQAADFDVKIQQKAEQIKQLTNEINELQQQRTVLANEVTGAKAEIEKVKNNFYATLNVITSHIKSDIDKIKQYLQGVK